MTKLKEVPSVPVETSGVPAKPSTPTTVDRVLSMIGELDSMRKQAIEDLLTQKRQIEEKLTMIGWNEPIHAKASGRLPSHPSSDVKHCKICNLDGHDARQHRFQGENKRKFTIEQLSDLGKK